MRDARRREDRWTPDQGGNTRPGTRLRRRGGLLGGIGLGVGVCLAAWAPQAAAAAPPMVYGGQPDFGGYVYTVPPAATTSIGGQWTLPTPVPATARQVRSGAKVYGGLSVWIGVQGTELAQTGTSTSEFPPALTVGRPSPIYPLWENAPAPPQLWTGRRAPGFFPGNRIGAWVARTATPRAWRVVLENLTTRVGYTARIARSTTGVGPNIANMWMVEDPGVTTLPPQPVTRPFAFTGLCLNGAAVDFWTMTYPPGTASPGRSMELNAGSNPVVMTVSNPSTTGDGFAIADGTQAPAPPPPNPTPGETIDVVWPTGRTRAQGVWRFTVAPGQAITLDGGGFGTSGTVTWNGLPLRPTAWTSASVTATIPADAAPGTGTLVLTPAGGVPTTWDSTLTVAPPPPPPPQWNPLATSTVRAGGTLTITGADFGTVAGTARWHRARFAWPVTGWTPTAITIAVPATARGRHTLTLQVPGAAAKTLALTVRPAAPTPHWHALATSTVQAGGTLTITGSGFGTVVGTARWHHARFAWPVTRWTPTAITVAIPATARGRHTLTLQVPHAPAKALTLTVRAATPPPHWGALLPGRGTPGHVDTLWGRHFGTRPGRLTWGATPLPVRRWTSGRIVFVWPSALHAATHAFTLTTAGAHPQSVTRAVSVR